MGRRIGEYQLGILKDRWVVSWWEEDGAGKKRKRFRLPLSSKRPEAEAVAELNRFIAEWEAAEAVTHGDLTIAEIFERYIQDRRKEGKNVTNQLYTWNALAPKFGALFPEDLNAPVMVEGERRTYAHEFAFERERAGLSRDTIWSYLTYLRTAMKWAHDRGLIEKRPYVWLPQKGAPRDIVMDEDDFEKLLNACSYPHLRLFVLLAAGTAARMSAILDLVWERVDFERMMIDFRTKKPKSILDKAGKKGRSVVEFGTALGCALLEAKEYARTPHVIEWNGARVKNIRKGLETAFRNAGVKRDGALSHLLRHSAATWLADESIDMRKIQKMLGHKDIRTTETIYAKYRRGYLSEPANVIDLKLVRKAG
jgi:integrase